MCTVTEDTSISFRKDFLSIVLSGGIAGSIEHFVMFPIDTIKTRMQTSNFHGGTEYRSVVRAILTIVKKEGFYRLYKGCSAIVIAAIPSHSFYFGLYETMRQMLDVSRDHYEPIKIMMAAIVATMGHDLIVTPVDVIKQRMQLKGSNFNNPIEAAMFVCKHSGYSAFIRSYPTTILLNVPYMATQFTVYENVKLLLKQTTSQNEETWIHALAGSTAGAVAAFLSSPQDVIKTQIQTNPNCGYQKLFEAAQRIKSLEGYKGFFRGVNARIFYCVPSSALTWIIYDGLRQYLGIDIDPEYIT